MPLPVTRTASATCASFTGSIELKSRELVALSGHDHFVESMVGETGVQRQLWWWRPNRPRWFCRDGFGLLH